MNRKPICVMSGDSEENGFILTVSNSKGCPKILKKKTSGYGTVKFKPKFSNIVIAFLLSVILFVGYVFILFFVMDIQNIIIKIMGCFVAVFSLAHVFVLFVASKFNQAREWHACEHKVINLLRNSITIDMENLKKVSRIDIHCSVFFVCLKNFLFINYIIICLAYRPVEMFVVNEPIVQLVSFGVISIPFWVVLVPLNYLLISPLVQYYLVTTEPSEDKLKQGLELAKEIEEIVNQE